MCLEMSHVPWGAMLRPTLLSSPRCEQVERTKVSLSLLGKNLQNKATDPGRKESGFTGVNLSNSISKNLYLETQICHAFHSSKILFRSPFLFLLQIIVPTETLSLI